MGQAEKGQSKLDALIKKNYDEFAEFANPGTKLSKGLDKIEDLRKVDIKNNVKGAKETVDGMRRKITPFAGMELPDPKYLVSHVGHDMQRFDKKRWSRLLSSAVVMRTNEQGQHQIVFLSSSNPKKGDFLLPKGGWDKGEDIKKAALREVIEEGGVNAQLAHGLGKVKFEDAGKKYTYFAYLMKANKIYDDWAESIRYRLWSLVAGEHSNAGGAAIAHAGRGGEGDDRIVGGADFGPGKTTTSSSNTKLVAALVRSKGCTSESDNMTMVAARVSLQ
ncbi:hypothetical protein JG687_00007990 [Phytophthora cactorum]|uniref:Nudix hydrolase domain-containing protein n=1 Tax=Phytophthora cactorum TaxID=29920 RepID=A0A8T1UI67_9STRA|nr:hypothetical protein JG687_00007990 [Phytophthora cactorum]